MKLRYVGLCLCLLSMHAMILSSDVPKPEEKKCGCWLPGYPSELPRLICERVKEFQECKKTGKLFQAQKEKMNLIWGEQGKSTDDLLLAARAAADAAGIPVIEIDARKDLKKARETEVFDLAFKYYREAEELSKKKQSPVLVIVKDAHVWDPAGYIAFLGSYQNEFDMQKPKETRYFTFMIADYPRNISASLWSRFGGGNECQILAPDIAERYRILRSKTHSRSSLSAFGAGLLALFTYGSTRKEIADGVHTALQTVHKKGGSAVGTVGIAHKVLSDNQRNAVYASGALIATFTGIFTYKYGKPYIIKFLQQLETWKQQSKPGEQKTEIDSKE